MLLLTCTECGTEIDFIVRPGIGAGESFAATCPRCCVLTRIVLPKGRKMKFKQVIVEEGTVSVDNI